MKKITYDYLSAVVNEEEIIINKQMLIADADLEEALVFINAEAYGEVIVENIEEPEPQQTAEERIAELETALALLLEGATE